MKKLFLFSVCLYLANVVVAQMPSGDTVPVDSIFTEEGLPSSPANNLKRPGGPPRQINGELSGQPLTVEFLRNNWPKSAATPRLEPLKRNIFIDPRRSDPAIVKKEGGSNTVSDVDRTQIAIVMQQDAWKQFHQLVRITGILDVNAESVVMLQVRKTNKIARIRVGESQRLMLMEQRSTGSTQGSANLGYYRVPTSRGGSQSPKALDSITLKLLKIQPNQLFFQIEEINGVTFFGEEQPIWVYELNGA